MLEKVGDRSNPFSRHGLPAAGTGDSKNACVSMAQPELGAVIRGTAQEEALMPEHISFAIRKMKKKKQPKTDTVKICIMQIPLNLGHLFKKIHLCLGNVSCLLDSNFTTFHLQDHCMSS